VAITDTTVVPQLLQTVYDLLAYQPLRTELVYEQFVSRGMVQRTGGQGTTPQPGSTVTFTFVNDLTEVASTIAESTDVTPQSMGTTQISVTAQEYGGAVTVTQRLDEVGLVRVSPIAAERIGRQMGAQMDNVVKAAVQAGTNVAFSGTATSRTTIGPTGDTLTAFDVRRAVAKLRGFGAKGVSGALYGGLIHPDASVDLRAEGVANGGWRPVHEYQAGTAIFMGEVGTFEGARFVESARAPLFADAGNGSGAGGTIDVYATLFIGLEAIAKVIGYRRQTVVGPVVDSLRRFQPVGWKAMEGFGRFREGALFRVESRSSIGNDL